ncbi:MAG: serine/threonine protein kinase [Oligoflexales bacterium]
MSQAGEPAQPEEIGPYRIVKEIGSGGLGRVFQALSPEGKIVAVKVLHEKFAEDPKFLGVFHREMLMYSGLQNRYIASYLDSYFEPPLCYIVTEYIDGWSGYQFQKQVGQIPPLVAVAIIFDLLQGLDHLHLRDVVHSDLSASNFMVSRRGQIFVMDFGLSCKNEIEDYRNFVMGTPGYYAPEHITNTPIGPYTDIYCAGLLLYQMLAGVRAVPHAKSLSDIRDSMKSIRWSMIRSTDWKMQRKLRGLVKGALKYNPSQRYTTTQDFMFECYQILKRSDIRYSRHAIHQFLYDAEMINESFDGTKQNIYFGWAGSI